MASDVEMSLEDIIRKGKQNKRVGRKGKPQQFKKQLPNSANLVRATSDARNKIISKKRTQIVDAREKLAELAKKKDARLKLEQLRNKKFGRNLQLTPKMTFKEIHQLKRSWPKILQNRERVFIDQSRQVSSHSFQPSTNIHIKRQADKKQFLDSRSIESQTLDYKPHFKPILRTVENDVIMIDPVEEIYETRNMSLNRKASLNFKIVAHNTELRDKGIGITKRMERERDKSPPKLTSILKKRSSTALRSEKKTDKPEIAPSEYRIIVSNLRNTVTWNDIQELFGDIGGLQESRLVRPGTAEVIYKNLQDAQRAVDLYHNRQLDGQPMNCLLVNPRANSFTRGTGLPLSSTSNVEPDLSTFHKVLFSNF